MPETNAPGDPGNAPVVGYELDAARALATVTLDAPHNRNALSRALVSGLVDALVRAEADPAVRVVLLRSSGRVFCSGADLSEAASGSMADGARTIVALQRRIAALPKPVVVRLDGPVRAGGIGIVAAADVVLAAESATFAFTEVKLGLAPAVISLTVLERLTSRAAAWTFLSGATFGAVEARDAGLVTRVLPDGDLTAAVDAACDELAGGSAQGLAETKALLNAGLLARLDDGAEAMAELSARLFGSDAAREAMTAFLSRRG